MESEARFLELQGLSKTIRIFHTDSIQDQDNSITEQDHSKPVDLWTRFFELHIQIADEKSHDYHFRPWKVFLNDTLGILLSRGQNKNQNSSPKLLLSFRDILHNLVENSKEVIREVVSYHRQIVDNQLSFMKTNYVSFSQEYLLDAEDYYAFWKGKFDKILLIGDQTDLDVINLMDSVKLFYENHQIFQNSIIHWPLPMGCHYPKLDETLEIFFSSLPPVPTSKYSTVEDTNNRSLNAIRIIQEEYGRAIEYLTSYEKQLYQRCRSIFPVPEILDSTFRAYRENIDEEVRICLFPLRSTCRQFEKARDEQFGLLMSKQVKDAVAAASSVGRILVLTKRKVREAIARFLISYYGDVKKQLKKHKKTIKRFQRVSKLKDLSFQLQLQNRLKAYLVWKEALTKAIGETKSGKLVVINDIYEALKFYYEDFLNDLAQDMNVSTLSLFNSFLQRD